MSHIHNQVALLGCLKPRRNGWSASWLGRCNWSMSMWSFICGWLTLRSSRRMTLACLESDHRNWMRTGHHFSIWGRINTFMKNELHNETAKWNTSTCCWSSRGLPYGLKDVGTDVNGHSCNKISYELSSSEINESCVGQRIKIGKHDQLQSSQLRCKLGSTYRCAFIRDFMVRSKNL